jgi:hypothetical protein
VATKSKVSAGKMICQTGTEAVCQKWFQVAQTNQVATSKVVETTLRNRMIRERGKRGLLELESIFDRSQIFETFQPVGWFLLFDERFAQIEIILTVQTGRIIHPDRGQARFPTFA